MNAPASLLAGAPASPRPAGAPAFTAPTHRITVGTRVLPSLDVVDLSVVLEKDQAAGFTMTVNDWQGEGIDRQGSTIEPTKYSSTTLFDPHTELGIELGYAEAIVPVIRAGITALSVHFGSTGTVMMVSGEDPLIRLLTQMPGPNDTKQWRNMRDAQVVEEIAQKLNISVVVDRDGPVQDQIAIKNQTYLAFLFERANRIDYEVYLALDADQSKRVDGAPVPPSAWKSKLYFVRRRDGADGAAPARVFTWGRDLISFTPRLATSHLVRSVTVRSWHPATKKAIVFTAERQHLSSPGAGQRGGPSFASDRSADIVVHEKCNTEAEVRALAIARLSEISNSLITGTAKTVGTPGLRPGMIVEFGGVGSRFNGRYQVTKVIHNLGAAGFTTTFEVTRPDAGEAKVLGSKP